MRVDGGDEELVLDKVPADSWSGWAVNDEGIYFVEPINNTHLIEFYSLATRRLTRIATATYITGLTVSKDGRFLVYTQLDAEDLNITLVENYR